jgi:NAD(P)-dependent dehydrogenase (short-subunit alcohol dehydrogenase family)
MTTFNVKDIPDLRGKTAVVTGASSGIGLAVAEALAGSGADVVLAVRNTIKGKAAAAGISRPTEVREIDLASLDSIRAFADGWDGEIDLLINNAGASANELSRTVDGFELQFGTNHLGHFALTNLLLDHVSGRVVTLGSQAERMGKLDLEDPNFEHRDYGRSQSYNQSKLANILFTAELQRLLTGAGSRVLAQTAHPGFVASAIYADAGPLAKTLVRLLAQTPEKGALPVLYAAVADLPGDSFTGPEHFMHMRGGAELIKRSKSAEDPELAKRLWSLSEELTGTRFPLGDSRSAA